VVRGDRESVQVCYRKDDANQTPFRLRIISERLPALLFYVPPGLEALIRIQFGMRCFTVAVAALFFSVAMLSGAEKTLLARVTVYWRSQNQVHACSNGAALRSGHCAVDPSRIPYGSKVLFPDGMCVAVDTGPDVINRKAARLSGRTPAQKNSLVIDRFFESRREALLWANAHPHFMMVRVVTIDKEPPVRRAVTTQSALVPLPTTPRAGGKSKDQDIDIALAGLSHEGAALMSSVTNYPLRYARRRPV
jgi:hypothetical protein